MNVNLHIDSIVLDGIEMGPGQGALLQQIVSSRLAVLINQHASSADNLKGQTAETHIRLGHSVGAGSIGPQLANAIYANAYQSHVSPRNSQGGQQ